jgi:hypothetical protein
MRYLSIIAGLLFLFSSCTTIEIKESDVFDVKRTISLEFFSQKPYKAEEIQIKTTDNLHLQAWYVENPRAEKTVLYFGGNGFVIETSYHIITSIVEQDVNLMVFNYRGYGQNQGNPSIEGIKADALAAYEYLVKKRKIEPENIILHGHSMGSFLATYTARQQEIAALVLESPITDLNDWSETALPWFLKPFINFEADSSLMKNSNLREVKKINIPLLLISGEEDKITPPQMAEKLYQNSGSQNRNLLIIKKGGHNDLPQKKIYQKALKRFYDSQSNMQTLKDSLIAPSSVLGLSRK